MDAPTDSLPGAPARGTARGYGGGTIYWNTPQARWVGAAEYPRMPGERRRKKVFVGRDREEVARRLDEWVAEHRPYREPPRTRIGNRQEKMRQARDLGTHTREEWQQKLGTYDGLCHYCGMPWGRMQKDHVVPVSRGGADGIDNVVPACARCNMMKSSLTGDEFMEWTAGRGSRPWQREPAVPKRHPGRQPPDEYLRRLRRFKQGYPEWLGGLL